MFRALLLIFFLFTVIIRANAQRNDDSLAQALVKKHIAINNSRLSSPGWRIQIYYGGQRIRANEIRAEFVKGRPSVPAYILYHQPNFKVRVGDFRSRLDAQKFLEEIALQYPSAFVVKDDVKLPEIE